MILLRRNAGNSLHIVKFRLCKSAEKNCSETGSYYSGLAYLKEQFEADSRPKGADIRRRLQKPDAKGGHRLFSLRMRPHALPRPAGGV